MYKSQHVRSPVTWSNWHVELDIELLSKDFCIYSCVSIGSFIYIYTYIYKWRCVSVTAVLYIYCICKICVCVCVWCRKWRWPGKSTAGWRDLWSSWGRFCRPTWTTAPPLRWDVVLQLLSFMYRICVFIGLYWFCFQVFQVIWNLTIPSSVHRSDDTFISNKRSNLWHWNQVELNRSEIYQ